MKKSECIAKYGEAAWREVLEQRREYHKEHKEQENANSKKWREEHPEQVIVKNREKSRKGGKRYANHLKGKTTGVQGDKNIIRAKHARYYKPYKAIIAPNSQIHHEWVPEIAEYRGVALVEADAHMHGFVDVIEILDGKITLLTEEEIKKKGEKTMDKEKKVEGKVTSWGIRLQVPAPVIKGIQLAVDDEVEWGIEEREGKMVAVLSKREIKE